MTRCKMIAFSALVLCLLAAPAVAQTSRMPANPNAWLSISYDTALGGFDIYNVSFFEVPDSVNDTLYFGVNDSRNSNTAPDAGGTGTTTFYLIGGSGTLSDPTSRRLSFADLGEATTGTILAQIDATNLNYAGWRYFSGVLPSQGEHIGNKYYFKIVAVANTGVDKNSYQVDISYNGTAGVSPSGVSGVRTFSYSWNVALWGDVDYEFYPFIPAGDEGKYLEYSNWDFDCVGTDNGILLEGWLYNKVGTLQVTMPAGPPSSYFSGTQEYKNNGILIPAGQDGGTWRAVYNNKNTPAYINTSEAYFWWNGADDDTSGATTPAVPDAQVYRTYSYPYTPAAADHVVVGGQDGVALSDGVDTESITAQVVDASGNPVPYVIDLWVDPSGSGRINGGAAGAGAILTTNSDGMVSFNLTDAVAELVTVSVETDGAAGTSALDDDLPNAVANGTVQTLFSAGAAPTLSMSASQTINIAQSNVALNQLTVTQVGAGSITGTGDIRVKLPAGLGLTFNAAITPTYGGAMAARVASTAYESGNTVLYVNLNTPPNVAAGDTLTISGLQVNTTTAEGSGRLTLSFDSGSNYAVSDDKIITVTDTSAYKWLGGTAGNETNWFTAANWSLGAVPPAGSRVVIRPATYQPILNAIPATLSALSVEPGATLTANAYAVTVTGNLTLEGTLASSGTVTVGGTLTITGTLTSTGTMALNGTVGQAVSTGGQTFNNLSVSGGTDTTTVSGALNVSGVLTLGANQTLDLGGNNFDIATLVNDGIVALSGEQTTHTIGTQDTNTGTFRYATAGSGAVFDYGVTDYFNLSLAGGTLALGADTGVAGTLTVSAGHASCAVPTIITAADVVLSSADLYAIDAGANTLSIHAPAGTTVGLGTAVAACTLSNADLAKIRAAGLGVAASGAGTLAVNAVTQAATANLGVLTLSGAAALSFSGTSSFSGGLSASTSLAGGMSLGAATELIGLSGSTIALGRFNVGALSLTVSADEINLTAGVAASVYGTGTLTLRPVTATQPINLGAAADAGPGSLDLTSAELLTILGTGFASVTLGADGFTGAITLAAAVNTAVPNLIIEGDDATPGLIRIDSAFTNTDAGRSLSLRAPVRLGANVGTNAGLIEFQRPVVLAETASPTVSTGAGAGNLSFGAAATIDGTAGGVTESLFLYAGTGTLSLGAAIGSLDPLGSLSLGGGTALALPSITLVADLSVAMTSGTATDMGILTVPGTASFALPAAQSLVLDVATSDFGTFIISSGTNASVIDASGIILDASVITGTLTVNADGPISQSGVVSAAGLTVTSVGGAALTQANTVGSFTATNTASGAIELYNTAAPLTVSNISQYSGGTVTIRNTGAITVSGLVNSGAGTVSLDTLGAGAIGGIGSVVSDILNLQTQAGSFGVVGALGSPLNSLASNPGVSTTTLNLGQASALAGAYVTHTGNLSLSAPNMAADAPLWVHVSDLLTLPAVVINTGAGILDLYSGDSLSTAAALSSSASVTLQAGTNLNIGHAVTGGTVSLTAADAVAGAGVIGGTALTVSANDGINLSGANMVLSAGLTNGGAGATGDVVYASSVGAANTLGLSGSNSVTGGLFTVTESTGSISVAAGGVSTANGDISLTASGLGELLTVAGALGNGGGANTATILLVADDMNLAAAITAGAGNVTLRPQNAATVIRLGGGIGGLLLGDPELDVVTTTGNLTVGDASQTGGIVVEGPVTRTGNLILATGASITCVAGTLSATGSLSLEAVSGIGVIPAASVAIGTVGGTLSATNTTSGDLFLSTAAVTLGGANPALSQWAGGALRVDSSGNIIIAGDLDVGPAGSIALNATGTITEQTAGAGTLIAGTVNLGSAGGTTIVGDASAPILTQAANLAGAASTGGFWLSNAGSAATAGTISAGTVLDLRSTSGLGLGHDVSGGSSVTLTVTDAGGTLAHTAGTISSGAGSVTLAADTMNFAVATSITAATAVAIYPNDLARPVSLGAGALAGSLGLSDAELDTISTVGTLTIGRPTHAGAIQTDGIATLTNASGPVILRTTSGGINLANNLSVAGSSLTLETTAAVVGAGALSVNAGAGTLTVSANDGISLGNPANSAGAAVLTNGASSGNIVYANAGALGVTANNGFAGGTLTLSTAAGILTVSGASGTTGPGAADISLSGAGGVALNAALVAGGSGYLSISGGGATQSTAFTAPGGLRLSGTGSFALTQANAAATLAAAVTGPVSLSVNGPLDLGSVAGTNGVSITGANALTLRAAGTVSQTQSASVPDGTVDIATLHATGANIELGALANDASVLSLRTLDAGGTLARAGTLAWLDASGFTLSALSSTAWATIQGGGGATHDITQSGDLALGGLLTITAGLGDAILDRATNALSSVNVPSSAVLSINDADGYTLNACLATGSITAASAAGGIVVAGPLSTAGAAGMDIDLNPLVGITLSYAGTVAATNGGAVYFRRPVTLTADAAVDTDAAAGTAAAGAVSFASTVGGASSLVLDASADGGGANGQITFPDDVSGLSALSATGDVAFTDSAVVVTTTGNQDYLGPVTLASNAVFTANAGSVVRFGGTLTGSSSALTVTTADARFDGNASAITTLSVDGLVAINADITTSGAQSYHGNATVGTSAALLAGAGTIVFDGGVAESAASTLTLQDGAATGNVTFSGFVDLSGLIFGGGAYAVTMNGGCDVVSPVTFANTGNVNLGDGDLDDFLFQGGLISNVTGFNQFRGVVRTGGAAGNDMSLDDLSVVTTLTLDSGLGSLGITGTAAVGAGETLDLSDSNFTIATLDLTDDSSVLRLTGTQATHAFTAFDTAAGVVEYYGSDPASQVFTTGFSGGTYRNLRIAGSGAGVHTLAGDVTVMNSLHVLTGVLDYGLTATNLVINNEWRNDVGHTGFIARSGTVTFDPTLSTIYIYGNNSWFVFHCSKPGTTILFENAMTQRIVSGGIFRVRGTAWGAATQITLNRMTPGADPSNPPLAPAEDALFWFFEFMPGPTTFDMQYVDVFYSNARAYPVSVPPDVHATPYNVHFCFKWLDYLYSVYSYTEDSDYDGKLDRIRVTTEGPVNADFSGFLAEVAGYEVDTNVGDNGYSCPSLVNPTTFYIHLVEKPYLDTGVLPDWHIVANTSLMDVPEQKFVGTLSRTGGSDWMTPGDGAWPIIGYTLTVPQNDGTFVHFSEPVAKSGRTGPIDLADFMGATGFLSVSGTASGTIEAVADYGTYAMADLMAGMSTMTVVASSEDLGEPPFWDVAYNSQIIGPDPPTWPPITGYTSDPSVDYSQYPPAPPTLPLDRPAFTLGRGSKNTHRVSDLLVSVQPSADPGSWSAANPDSWFVWPIWAKDSGYLPGDVSTFEPLSPAESANVTVGLVRAFDGTQWLRDQDIVMQSRLNPVLVAVSPTMFFDSNVDERYVSAVPGIWLPEYLEVDFSGLAAYPNLAFPSGGVYTQACTDDGGGLWGNSFDADHPEIHDRATLDFWFRLSGTPTDLYAGRLDMQAGAAALPAEWYRLVRPFSFDIRDLKTQRGGVTILNNVIDPTTGERTRLNYVLDEEGPVTIAVFTLDGDVVTVLQRGRQAPGDYTVSWDGRNDGGRPVARGVYFIRVVAPGMDEIRKVMVVRN
ncbi:MAG: hypothetical protein JW923_10315 [Spirochaetales bacterium]|nr:hypothetical protein [Spirochaetales bacterium]